MNKLEKGLVILIKIYQFCIAPILPSSCKFIPTCSEYTLDAVKHHGAKEGTRLGLKRLLRCHPFHRGGFDPVPPNSA